MRTSLLLWVHAAFSTWLLPRCHAIYVPDNADPPAFCTVFGHIMKSGGSTIKWALDTAQPQHERQPGLCVIGVYEQDRCNAVATNKAVIEGCGELARRALTVSGRENCNFFTMMRHPIDRLISQFFYCPRDHDIQGRPAKWCGTRGNEEDLPARLLEFAAQSWGNHAWRMMMFGVTCPPQPGEMCGTEIQPSFQLLTAEDWYHLEVAERILSTYTAVGILEHWSLSMSLFDAKVQSPVRRWADMTLRVNKGVQPSRREWVHQWALNSTEVRSIVQGDLVLYEHALSLFRSQTANSMGTVWGDV